MIFGFEIDLQAIFRSLTPAIGRIFLVSVVALIGQQIISKIISQSLKIATTRHTGEDKEEFGQRIDTLSSVVTTTIGLVIWVIALLTILSEVGINIAPLLTGAGIAGIAIGFGAQNIVRDMRSGLFILIENQYTKGDVVRIAGLEGLVEEINLRRTVLRDLDGIEHSVPNSEIKTASNLTAKFSRINLNLMVEDGKKIEDITKTIDKTGKDLNSDRKFGSFIAEAPHVLRVEELAKEGVVLKIVGTTRPIKQWEVLGELRKRLKEAFDTQKTKVYEQK